MVEVKFGESWPRDANQDGKSRDWKYFEVGDKIDIFDVCFFMH